MKLKMSAIVVMLVASLAYSQSATQSTAKKSAAKKTAAAPAAAKSTAKATAPKAAKAAAPKTAKVAAKAAAPVAKTKAATHSPMAAKPAKPAHHAAPKATPAPAATASAVPVPAAEASKKRDPFVNPVQAVREGRGDACSGGKRCLAANEIVLRGIVKAQNGMIAVVESSAQRTYFLRENDAIYNGFVQKITPDTVTFREHYLDNLGRDAQRDIVKTVNAPVV